MSFSSLLWILEAVPVVAMHIGHVIRNCRFCNTSYFAYMMSYIVSYCAHDILECTTRAVTTCLKSWKCLGNLTVVRKMSGKALV